MWFIIFWNLGLYTTLSAYILISLFLLQGLLICTVQLNVILEANLYKYKNETIAITNINYARRLNVAQS